ncbi:MAG: hypothetical protein OXN89_07340 [Bryobacterales bacterium]|nr:hypothetical protein [Bryobacterales bacterium]
MAQGEKEANESGLSRGAGMEAWLGPWRAYVASRCADGSDAVEVAEERLRGTTGELQSRGLEPDEAFLVAVRRVAVDHAPTAEYARQNLARFWERQPDAESDADSANRSRLPEIVVVLALAVGAAVSVKLAGLAEAASGERADAFFVRNAAFFTLPWLAAYFLWKRFPGRRLAILTGIGFSVAIVLVNAYPFDMEGMTVVLSGLHMPIALWLLVGIAYTGGEWSRMGRRMDFVRFSGDLVICFVLIALGGGALTALSVALFSSIGLDLESFAENWILPCGACGAVTVSAWLAEVRRGMIGGMASLLARVFTPLLSIVLVVFLSTMVWTRQGIEVERHVLVAFDVILILVVCLLLYSLSSRERSDRPNWSHRLQLVLVVCAVLVDLVALAAVLQRISEYGASANKLAALAENLILLVNLAWTAWLYVRVLRGKAAVFAIERWQTAYLPVYAAWAAVVVVLFPPLFRFA